MREIPGKSGRVGNSGVLAMKPELEIGLFLLLAWFLGKHMMAALYGSLLA